MMPRCTERLPPRDGVASGWEASHSRHFGPFSLLLILFILILKPPDSMAAVPRFFESNRMAILLLPEDTEVESIIYRLRAEDVDRDYPLLFQVKGAIGRNLIRIEPHECTPSSQIYCEADVYLARRVERDRVYMFNLTVSDQRGFQTEVVSRIDANPGKSTKTSDIFLRFPTSVVIREDIPPKAIIASIIARRRPKATFGEFQVLGKASKLFKAAAANLVSQNTINGTLMVESGMDYEVANLHTFKVCLLQPYTNRIYDTRNIACVIISVVIQDVQDEAPIFLNAPPVTRVPSTAVKGDIIGKIEARDGDRGVPRSLRYSMLPASSIYKNFFRIHFLTGEIIMNNTAHNLRENMVSLDPILMTVTAEEVIGLGEQYPALSSSCEIAFVVLDADLLVPKFVHEKYVGEIYEDSVPDSQVFFDSPFLVQGVKGLFALTLEGDNGAFSVQPGVVKDASEIKIRVKNSFLIDFEETPQLTFKLVARQVSGPQQLSGSTEVTVRLLDTNDNIPKFSKQQYEVELFENVTRGATVVRVFANDKDSGPFGVVRYTNMYGPLAERLYLDPTTGVITCATDNHGLDREAAPEHIITVEAKDNNGQGTSSNTATVKVIIRMKDVNDSPPKFVESLYKGVMTPDYQRLKDPIRLRAVDSDAERPNNEVVYAIERSSYSDFFHIDRNSGYLDVRQNYVPRFSALNENGGAKSRKVRSLSNNDTVITLRVRASDLGEPQLSDSVDVKIFKQEFGERLIRFIYPKPHLEVRSSRRDIEKVLNTLTGGSTEIMNIQPLSSGFLGSRFDPERSEVTALVRFGVDTVVDLQELLSKLNNSEVQKLKTEKLQKEEVIRTMEGQNYSYLLGVVFLCVILCMMITIIVLCCVCEGCPLYNQNRGKYNMAADEGGQGSGDIRNAEGSKYRGGQGGQSWFNSLPTFAKNMIIGFGYVPPDKSKSKMAWSADERQRNWQLNNTHAPDVSSYLGNNTRGEIIMEDLDNGQYNRAGPRPDQFMRVDSRLSHRSQEPKRVFVIKDPRGERIGGSMRDGDTYLLEENEDAQNATVQQSEKHMMNGTENEYPYNGQGNGQFLRISTSLPDAAYTSERQRRVRRAGVESEESVRHFIDPGGGISSRSIDGQLLGTNPRSNRDYYSDDKRSYDQRYLPRHNDAYIQTDENRDPQHIPRMNMIREESRNFGSDRNSRSVRDRRSFRSDIGRSDKTTQEPVRKTSQSAKSNSIPGTHGYQHTKTSILRYESNKAKLDEEREELIRQGKDPSLCLINHGGGSLLLGESRKTSVNNSRSNSKTEKRSYHDRRERRGSLTEVEGIIEDEDNRILQRRNSAENYDNNYIPNSNLDRIVYVNEANQPLLMQAQNSSNIIAADDLRIVDGKVQIPYNAIANTNYIPLNDVNLPVTNNIPGDNPHTLPNNQPYHTAVVQGINEDVRIPQNASISFAENNIPLHPSYLVTGQQIIQLPPSLNNGENIQPLTNTAIQINQPYNQTAEDQIVNNDVTQKLEGEIASEFMISNEQEKNVESNDYNTDTGPIKTVETNVASADEQRTTNISKQKENPDLNLPDDVKSAKGRNKSKYNKDNVIHEKQSRNDQSVMNIPQSIRKKNKMLEKKSVFTIAYDGMKTDHLRPESAAQEP